MSSVEQIQASVYTGTERLLAASGLAVFGAGCLVVALVDPSRQSILPACPLLTLTGFACPGCGLTRGFHHLFHGDLLTALDFNALVPFWALAFVYMVVYLSMISLRGRRLAFGFSTPAVLWIFLTVSVTFGVLRNIPVHPFSVLYP